MKRNRHSARWWPLVAVLVLTAAALVWTATSGDMIGQQRFLRSALIVVIALILVLIWLVGLSRLPWSVRWAGLLGAVGVVVLAALSLEIKGVSGDLVPILEWKWSTESRRAMITGSAGSRSRLEGDFTQFLGPWRDGTLSGIGLAEDWSARAPEELWRRSVGPGWSGFAVSGGVAVTMEQQGGEEQVVAYEVSTGELLWVHADEGRYETTIAGIGPRSTPTLWNGRVFTLGANGLLNALELESGRLLWSHDVLAESGGVLPEWGKSCSPLVIDGLVVVSAGGGGGRSLIAYDALSGVEVWSGGSDGSGFSSPLVTTLAGRRQVIIFNRASVVGHDPATGEVLWSYPWSNAQPNVAMPVVLPGERLLVSSGYGIGSELLKVDLGEQGRLEVAQQWRSPRLKAKFTNPVFYDGFIYGLDDGTLVCLDPETGERRWKRGRYGHGQTLLVDDLLLVMAENGEVVLIRPNPDGLVELGRFAALSGKTWNTPALAGDLLLVRNDTEAACFRLPLGP